MSRALFLACVLGAVSGKVQSLNNLVNIDEITVSKED